MNHSNKKKKSRNEPHEFEFCEVCKLNHNHGRRHNYLPSHKNSLSSLLARFQSKLSDVKFFLKTPMPILPELAHQNRLWCVFCNCDIVELDSQFACNAVEHLAGEEHWKRVKGFMWKYGGGMDRVDLFRISEADYAKWEKKCKTLKMEAAKTQSVGTLNDIHNKHNAEFVNSSCNNNFDALNSCIPNYVVPLHSYTDERTPLSSSVLSSSVSNTGPSLYNISGDKDAQYLKNSTGYVDNQHFSNSLTREGSSYDYSSNGSVYSGVGVGNGEISPGLVHLTQVSSTSKVALEGNVHTGAPPPWLDATKGDKLNPAWKPESRDPVSSRAGKSKLNPKRVGAAWAERRKLELEMERRGEHVNSNFDANWLPNFGRVWQSGTRKDSRKEFQTENKAAPEADDQSEAPVLVQPYISKRMRKDAANDKHVSQ
ncbi:TITAN-like protein isoform X2 [Salvia miltiorrhiza]|uniref:TITAN-like protein isoform X2 n=1 Tax=Salvia miltiorrhiza TaxID=226208 RepID=UPI0025ACCE50|nr:TITAN-like protein isoform X2 [Salvia miltiorrhiza]